MGSKDNDIEACNIDTRHYINMYSIISMRRKWCQWEIKRRLPETKKNETLRQKR